MGATATLSWSEWIVGLLRVVWDVLIQRYAARHVPPRLALPALPHLTVMITGATSGIGLQTARALALSGAHVIFAVRSTNVAKDLISQWQAKLPHGTPPLNCEVMELDCLSFDSVRKLAETWEARKLPLNLLINNAGIFCMTEPQKFSKDGCEQHMQVNHLAPALLTVLLLPSLARGAPSRVVMVNSIMHHLGNVDPKDLNAKDNVRKFYSTSAYSTSKLAQVMFSNLLQRRLLKDVGIDVVCVHPGEVRTQVARNLPKIVQKAYAKLFFLFTSEEGARSVLFCATDKQVQDHARRLRSFGYPLAPYFGPDLKIWPVGKQALDMETAHLLWEETFKLIGLPADYIEAALTDRVHIQP